MKKILKRFLLRFPISKKNHGADMGRMLKVMKAQQEYIMMTRNDLATVAYHVSVEKSKSTTKQGNDTKTGMMYR